MAGCPISSRSVSVTGVLYFKGLGAEERRDKLYFIVCQEDSFTGFGVTIAILLRAIGGGVMRAVIG